LAGILPGVKVRWVRWLEDERGDRFAVARLPHAVVVVWPWGQVDVRRNGDCGYFHCGERWLDFDTDKPVPLDTVIRYVTNPPTHELRKAARRYYSPDRWTHSGSPRWYDPEDIRLPEGVSPPRIVEKGD